MKYQAVFFDLDGTVLDTLQNITNAVNHTMLHFGRPEFPAEQIKPHLGWGVDHLMRTLVPELTAEELAEMLAFYRPYYALHTTENVELYEGILPMMETLQRRGLKLAIISNKPDNAVQPLAKRDFQGLVSLAMGETPGIARKPAPDMLVYAADRLKVELSACLYVGDTEVDLQTAKNTGIDCICITWGFRTREVLMQAGAVSIAENANELIRLICGQA